MLLIQQQKLRIIQVQSMTAHQNNHSRTKKKLQEPSTITEARKKVVGKYTGTLELEVTQHFTKTGQNHPNHNITFYE